VEERREDLEEEVTSGPVTHGGEGDPLGEGVAEAGADEDEGEPEP
jgi:hypothetical protein